MSVIAVDPGTEAGIEHAAETRERMPGGIVLSATLHVGLLALILFGLPNLFHHPPPEETPIAVELVTIAPDTKATHPNPYRPKPEAKPEPAIATPAPKPEPKPEPPTPAVSEPPPSAAAPPPPAPPQPPKPEIKPAPPPPPPKPVEAQAPPPPPRPPEPKPKPEPQPVRHAAPAPADKANPAAFAKLIKNLEDKHPEPAQFDSLLKNLTRQQTAEAEDTPPPARPQIAATAPPSSQPKAPLGSQLTASERDLIIQQIERCWVVPAGARDAQDLNIEVKAVVNPDGTVRQAAIIDTGRYAADPFFRAAADSAKRAILNPQCSPLRLPPDKYEAWHDLDLFFNPKDLL